MCCSLVPRLPASVIVSFFVVAKAGMSGNEEVKLEHSLLDFIHVESASATVTQDIVVVLHVMTNSLAGCIHVHDCTIDIR